MWEAMSLALSRPPCPHDVMTADVVTIGGRRIDVLRCAACRHVGRADA